MGRRTSGIVIAAVGAVLIVVAIVQNLFSVGPAFEEMIDDFRPYLADEPIATLRGDIDMLGGAVEEFQTEMAAALAQQLEMDQAAFGQLMAENFPAVLAGMEVVPEAAPTFVGIVDLLDAQRSNFASADAIPTTSLPATTVPWGIVIVGLAFVGLGVYMYVSQTRTSALAAVITGLVIVVGAFALSLPGKSADADALNDALKPVYTQETIDGAAGAVAAIEAMGAEMQSAMLPGLGEMLGLDAAEVQGFVGSQFPAVATALAAMPDAVPRFNGVVDTFSANLDNYETLRPVAFAPIIWTVIVGSLLVSIAAAVTLFGRRDPVDRADAPEEKREPATV